MQSDDDRQKRGDLLLFSNDLMVASELEGVARMAAVGFQRLRPDQIPARDLATAGLAVVDLAGVEAAELVQLVGHLHQAAIRVLAFGPHVQAQRLNTAKQAGCDRVVTRGSIVGEVRAAIVRNG